MLPAALLCLYRSCKWRRVSDCARTCLNTVGLNQFRACLFRLLKMNDILSRTALEIVMFGFLTLENPKKGRKAAMGAKPGRGTRRPIRKRRFPGYFTLRLSSLPVTRGSLGYDFQCHARYEGKGFTEPSRLSVSPRQFRLHIFSRSVLRPRFRRRFFSVSGRMNNREECRGRMPDGKSRNSRSVH